MTIAAQVNLALTRASVCLGDLSPEMQVQLAARMQAVADALQVDAPIPAWPFWGSLQPLADRSDRCQALAVSDSSAEQLGYRQWCLDWEALVAFQLRELAAFERSVGCNGAAEVAEAAAQATLAEGEQAREVLPTVSNIEIPNPIKGLALVGAALGVLALVVVLKP